MSTTLSNNGIDGRVVYKSTGTNTCRSTMSLQTLLLRSAIICGMIAAVVTILYFTPIPEQYFLSCERPCHDHDWPMICRIKLEIELHQTIPSLCNACLITNSSQCQSDLNCIFDSGVNLLTVNRQIPGPAIHVCQNDVVVVDVVNKVPGNSLTLHWRGQYQSETPFMDGVPMISQCPITSYTTFQYKFRAAVPGTHLWHAYLPANNNNGLFGPLIIRQTDKLEAHRLLYDFDKYEHVFLISFINDALMINGKVNSSLKINVQTKKRYRFRVSYAAGNSLCPIRLSIDEHVLKIIALDGNPIAPKDVSSIVLNRGERCDFILKTKHQHNLYFMRVRIDNCGNNNASIETNAILKYTNSNNFDTDFQNDFENQGVSGSFKDIKFTTNRFCEGVISDQICVDSVKSLEKLPIVLREQNMDRKLHFSFEPITDHVKYVRAMQMNNRTFTFPSSPLLTQTSNVNFSSICSSKSLPNYCHKTINSKEICECLYIEKIKLDSTVELILIDEGGDLAHHIFHLHGYSFWIVGVRQFTENINLNDIKELDHRGMLFNRNLLNPVRKDTIIIPKHGVVALRFVADNPGFWLLREEHNSILWTQGTDVILQVGEQKDFVSTPTDFPLCGNFIGPDFFLA